MRASSNPKPKSRRVLIGLLSEGGNTIFFTMKKFFYHINLFFVVLSTILSLQSQNSSYQIVIGDDEDETDPKVVIAPNGNYFLFNRTTSNSFGRADMMLTMISGNGEPIWSKNFGSDYREYSKNIYQLGNEYLLLGWRSDIGKADMWFYR